jgi:hypothetical protein
LKRNIVFSRSTVIAVFVPGFYGRTAVNSGAHQMRVISGHSSEAFRRAARRKREKLDRFERGVSFFS